MRPPRFDIRLEHVADHALPTAKRLRGLLWRWSPWHREYLHHVRLEAMTDLLVETTHDLRDTLRRLEGSEERRKQLVRFIDKQRDDPLPGLVGSLVPAYAAEVVRSDWDCVHHIDWRPERMAVAIPDHALALAQRAGDVDDLVDRATSNLAGMLHEQAVKAVRRVLAQNRRRRQS